MAPFANVLDIIDKKKAGDLVDAIYAEEVACSREDKQLRGFIERMNNNQQEQLVVVKAGVPSYHRLYRATSDGALEEVVLTMSGMLIESNLPPILSTLKNTLGKRARYARRGVHIAGFESGVFSACIQELAAITEIFQSSGGGVVDNYTPLDYRGFPAVNTANNYFTLKKTVPFENFKPFTAQEDPFNVLNNFAAGSKEEVVRIADNDIQMYKKEVTYDGSGLITSKIVPYPSVAFQLGDIIQVQMSFAMFKLSGPEHKGKFGVRNILRSVALMDTTLKKHAMDKIFSDAPGLWGPPLRIKRSVGYEDDNQQTEEGSRKTRRLAITYK